MDKRLLPANARVAARHLQGQVTAEFFVDGDLRSISKPLVNLLSAPHGRRERQLVLGEQVHRFEKREGWAFVQCLRDGYVGYLPTGDLDVRAAPTHRVTARFSHVYSEPNFKSFERQILSAGSLLHGHGVEDGYLVLDDGYLPLKHVTLADAQGTDIVAEATRYLGTPYLWGGNSSWGIDCSGLVQAACLACGVPCHGDSDLQQAELGRLLPEGTAARKGDVLFWKGHVALVAGRGQILHANAHTMTTSFEPMEAAIERIKAAGDGPVLAHKRLPRPALADD